MRLLEARARDNFQADLAVARLAERPPASTCESMVQRTARTSDLRASQPAPSPYGCRRTVASESLPRTRGADPLSRRRVPNCRADGAPELRGKQGARRVG